jgi:hypothetical protein
MEFQSLSCGHINPLQVAIALEVPAESGLSVELGTVGLWNGLSRDKSQQTGEVWANTPRR